MYSITSRQSFDEVSSIRDQVLRVKDSDDVPIVLLGNKCDLEEERTVSTDEGRELAKVRCFYLIPKTQLSTLTTPFKELGNAILRNIGEKSH